MLTTLLVLDQGDGVEIGRVALSALMRCDRHTLPPAIDELRAEGLLSVTTPRYAHEMGLQASTYRLAVGARHEHAHAV